MDILIRVPRAVVALPIWAGCHCPVGATPHAYSPEITRHARAPPKLCRICDKVSEGLPIPRRPDRGRNQNRSGNDMKVPEGRPTIARCFNGGFRSLKAIESRRGERKHAFVRAISAPFGATRLVFTPTVKTVGYFLSSRWDFICAARIPPDTRSGRRGADRCSRPVAVLRRVEAAALPTRAKRLLARFKD